MGESVKESRMMLRLFVISLILGSSLTTAALAQMQGPSRNPGKTTLMILAERLGRAAGNAEFCGYDPDNVEEFIAKSMARLAKESEDKVLLAGSRVEFNAHAAYGRSEGPEQGCDSFSLDYAEVKRILLY